MKHRKLCASALVATLGTATLIGSFAIAEPAKDANDANDAKPAAAAGKPEMKLPPGWTEADMQACMVAATPGKMQEHLVKGVGVWNGKTTMWMGPGGEPMTSETTSTVSKVMDGRYIKVEIAGDLPGMGPYTGMGLYGYDNAGEKFVSTWIDNHSTGIMTGTGELSPDGKTLTWKYTYTCPLTKKPAVLREVETITGPNTKTLEMFGAEPKSGKEFKMMSIQLTKK